MQFSIQLIHYLPREHPPEMHLSYLKGIPVCPRAYGHANMNDTSKVHLSLKENKQVKFNKVPVFMCRLKILENLKGKSINCDGEQQGKHKFL